MQQIEQAASPEADWNQVRLLLDAERYKVETPAAARKFQLETEAAAAKKARGLAEAAIVELIVPAMPKIAGQISAPLAQTEKMVIIDAGSGSGGGASKLTGDVTAILSPLPPLVEALTGVKFEKLLEPVPMLKNALEKKPE